MEQSKIQLSAEEMNLVTNTDWILTKQAIISKIYRLFGEVSDEYRQLLDQSSISFDGAMLHPKISKGENYKNLPYVILDYPRIFKKEDVFAVRTFFWWGNYFSITLLLSGSYKQEFIPQLLKNQQLFADEGFLVSTTGNPWEHDFTDAGMVSLKEIPGVNYQQIIRENTFIKMGKLYPLTDWHKVSQQLINAFGIILRLLDINCLTGEKGL